MAAVRHLAGPDAIADDIGLSRARFDQVARLVTALSDLLEDDEPVTAGVIARETSCTPDQVSYIWRAWVRSDQHPAARR
jgi:hypothetical protein